MIRPYNSNDLEQVMSLWLDSTISAHPFIDAGYWHQVKPLVAEQYLPHSVTWVYEHKQEILGFISILDNNLIGALFVKTSSQQTGIGKALIEYAKLNYPLLLLEVYPQNERAYQFYQRMGFKTLSESFNEETGAMVATMCYQTFPYN